MEDADDRIVEDIKKLTQGFATGISDIAFNVIAGTVYVYRLWRAYGWIYAVAPYAYLFFGFRLVDKLTPLSLTGWGLIPRDVTTLSGILTMPFIHGTWSHIIGNTIPLLVLLLHLRLHLPCHPFPCHLTHHLLHEVSETT